MTQLKVERLHLREYRAIRSLDLPEDGLGWGATFPDTVVIGGGNGSGKTTLLHWIVTAFRGLWTEDVPMRGVVADIPAEGRLDVLLTGSKQEHFSYLAGPEGYVRPLYEGMRYHAFMSGPPLSCESSDGFRAVASSGPRILFVPSPRDLILPATQQKSAGRLQRATDFIYVWQPPATWLDSTEALLYEARWLDLNAKEEGRPEEATHFERYAAAFASLLPGRALIWRHGELVVQVTGSDVYHALSALSSGEKQILVLLADLLLHWTPGSIVLIDEPELHLHTSLQIRLYEALLSFRAARGGQLWLATQSTELFGHAADGTKALLGAGSLL